jgi:hypothetical protein
MDDWKTIPSFPLYQASSEGRIRRDPDAPKVPNTVAVLAVVIGKNGYPVYRVRRFDYWEVVSGHTLVCEAFHGPKPTPKHEVAHGDGVRANIAPSNLRWATRAENHADKKLHGTNRQGSGITWAKLDERTVADVKRRLINKEAVLKIAASYGVSEGAINGIRIGKNWKHVAPAQAVEVIT